MFFRKKKNNEVTESKIRFTIPQVKMPYQGIKKSRDKFEKAVFSSAIFGTGIKDTPTYTDASDMMSDIKRNYDSFRDKKDKKVSDAELIAKYGTKYPEFQQVDLKLAKEIYGEEISLNKVSKKIEEPKSFSPGFNFIKNVKDETIKTTNKEESLKFDFNDNGESEEIDNSNPYVRFNDFKPKKEINTESNNYFSRNSLGEDYSNKNTTIVRRKVEPVTEEPIKTFNSFNDNEFYKAIIMLYIVNIAIKIPMIILIILFTRPKKPRFFSFLCFSFFGLLSPGWFWG